MNPGAFEILKKIKLPCPKVYGAQDLGSLSSGNCYYLRYNKEFNIENQVVSGREIFTEKDKYIDEISKNILLSIESTYSMTFGGATLMHGDYIYTEFVTGHPIALLRRGLCGIRFILKGNKILFRQNEFQGWEATQGEGARYYWEPTKGPTTDNFNMILNHLSVLKNIHEKNLLLEWFISNNQIVFCDAKYKGFVMLENDFGKIIDGGEVYFSKKISDGTCKTKYYDCFDIDFNDEPEDFSVLYAHNSSILSHYVTRSVDRNINIVLRTSKYGNRN